MLSDNDIKDLSSPPGSEYVPDVVTSEASKAREEGEGEVSVGEDKSDYEHEPSTRKQKSKTDISTHAVKKGKGKAMEQSGGCNLRRKHPHVVSRTLISSSEDEGEELHTKTSHANTTELPAVQHANNALPLIQLYDEDTSVIMPPEDLTGPSADDGAMFEPPGATSTLLTQGTTNMQVPPCITPVPDTPSVSLARQTGAPSAPTPTAASTNSGAGMQESLLNVPPPSPTTHPKPQQYVRNMTEAERNEADEFSLCKRIRPSLPNNDSPSILLAAEEGRTPSEVVDNRPGLPLPATAIPLPTTSIPALSPAPTIPTPTPAIPLPTASIPAPPPAPAIPTPTPAIPMPTTPIPALPRPSKEDRKKEQPIQQQQVFNPYLPHQSQHYDHNLYLPHAHQLPSPQGFTDHAIGSGIPVTGDGYPQ